MKECLNIVVFDSLFVSYMKYISLELIHSYIEKVYYFAFFYPKVEKKNLN